MFCPQCQTEQVQNSKFCHACGVPLPNVLEQTANEEVQTNISQEVHQSSSPAKAIWVGIVVVVLFLILMTNPTKEQYIAWMKEQAENKWNNPLAKAAISAVGTPLLDSTSSRDSYGFFSIFRTTLPGVKIEAIGICNTFIPVMYSDPEDTPKPVGTTESTTKTPMPTQVSQQQKSSSTTGLSPDNPMYAIIKSQVQSMHDAHYIPVSYYNTPSTYTPDILLPIGNGENIYVWDTTIAGGDGSIHLVFFFHDVTFLGTDGSTGHAPVIKMQVWGSKTIEIVYAVYQKGDHVCCPSGKSLPAFFHWDGTKMYSVNAIP